MTIEMKAVDSSNVQSVGYNSETKELFVKFNNNSTYKYSKVPEQTFNGLVNAESVGKFLNSQIKNVYDFKKITAPALGEEPLDTRPIVTT